MVNTYCMVSRMYGISIVLNQNLLKMYFVNYVLNSVNIHGKLRTDIYVNAHSQLVYKSWHNH